MKAAIPFPNFSPELFSISLFGMEFALRWYALAYIAGILIAWRLGVAAVKRPALWRDDTPPMTPKQIEDLLTWIILGVILGGRLGFVLFYQPAYYLQNPAEILMVWQGGMSFHGGFLGVVMAAFLFARKHNIPPLSLADMLSTVAPVGLFFGRVANFINGELYGRVSDVSWAMVFPGGGPAPRHPSQLYEAALEGALLFIIIMLLRRTNFAEKPGLLTGVFLIGYALARGFVELFRQPDAHLGFLFGGATMGQLLSVPMIIIGGYLIMRTRPAEK